MRTTNFVFAASVTSWFCDVFDSSAHFIDIDELRLYQKLFPLQAERDSDFPCVCVSWKKGAAAPLLSTVVTGLTAKVEGSGALFEGTSKTPLALRFADNHFSGKRGKPVLLGKTVFWVFLKIPLTSGRFGNIPKKLILFVCRTILWSRARIFGWSGCF